MWTTSFWWLLLAFLLLEDVLSGRDSPARKKALRKEKKEMKKLLRTIGKHTKEWKQSWEKSKYLKKQQLTKAQKRYWRKLAELPEDDDDDDDDYEKGKRSIVQDNEADTQILSRTKRSGPTIPPARRVRREWRHMTLAQKQRFINAFNRIALSFPDPIFDPLVSVHDIFVEWHRFSNAPGAHNGASFLPWHREFLWRMSNALRLEGFRREGVDLPYFDSALDQFLPNPRDSAIWIDHPEGIGINQGFLGAPFNTAVTTLIPDCGGSTVTRQAVSAASAKTRLYTRTKYQLIMQKQCYDFLTLPTDFEMESFHNTGHTFVGGTMSDASCSPGDPVFWLHHTNVDCLWEDYRQNRQRADIRPVQYPLGASGDFAWNTLMEPFDDWGLMNIHGLSNHYGNYYYRCAPRPSDIRCTQSRDCVPEDVENPMLWCHIATQFCVAKIRPGGVCEPDWPDEQCFCFDVTDTPSCIGAGTCVCN